MIERGRLLWKCRRGMRELDTLLTNYVMVRYPLALGDEQRAFECALDLADPVLWACVLGQEVPADPALRHVIREIAGLRV